MAYSFKGAIEFGLVYIPITLSACVKNNDIGFNMIEKHTMSRVKYKKTCVDCNNKEISNEDIVKGFEYEKGKYVIFTNKDFEKLKTPKDKSIVIEQFVDLAEVDPVFFDKSYYVQPVGADKAFCLLLQAMQQQNKAGIAKTVLGNKETLILIRAHNGQMILNTMFFYEEILSSPQIKQTKITSKELNLATSLIKQMSSTFKPENFKDEYNQKIKKAIKQKIAGNQIVAPKQQPAPTRVINIMEALQQSLQNPNRKTKPTTTPKRKAK